MSAERFLFVVGAAYIYSGNNNERESANKIYQFKIDIKNE